MTHACLLGPAGFIAGAGLPLTDRGFRYGMSVFETVAVRGSRPLLLEQHLGRLSENSTAARFLPPPQWIEACRSLLARPPIAEGVARIYITAGDHDGGASRVAALFEEMPIRAGLGAARAATVEFTPALPFGKTGNYWPHFLARPASGDEAILCTPQGLLLGGCMSNLFLILDDALATPRQPIRRGVVRDWVAAGEADLTRDDLARATAAFLTNSRFGLCELTAVDGRSLEGDARIGQIWRRYHAEVLGGG